jgi:hypothetical protein
MEVRIHYFITYVNCRKRIDFSIDEAYVFLIECIYNMSHRTSMNIPKDLLEEALRASGAKTQTMAVVMGLEELIRRKKIEALLKLKGAGTVRLSPRELRVMRSR